MYLISLYFDEKIEKTIQQLIDKVAEKSGNKYMIEGRVPPHITISAFETEEESKVINVIDKVMREIKRGTLNWVSIGVFKKQVIFLMPVLNEYLHNLSFLINDSLLSVSDITFNKFYMLMQWVPHTTIGKKLSEEEMIIAFKTLQNNFKMFSGQVTKIGLAKTNPYEEIKVWIL